MRVEISMYRVVAAVVVSLGLVACDSVDIVEPGDSASLSVQAAASQDALLKSVRQATSRFNSTTQAIKAGYVRDDHCVAHPILGGMGYHWVNPSLVDGEFDPLQPEVLLYASGKGGNLRLAAVEYIVLTPPEIWELSPEEIEEYLAGPNRPQFGTHPFDIRGTPVPLPHWSLHVWVHETNPSGIFTPFNPNVSCP
jgi:hypothetical protein